jgi:hypothetical protein
MWSLMTDNDRRLSKERKYPELYEKLVPIALGVILAAIAMLLIVAVAVALGLFTGT